MKWNIDGICKFLELAIGKHFLKNITNTFFENSLVADLITRYFCTIQIIKKPSSNIGRSSTLLLAHISASKVSGFKRCLDYTELVNRQKEKSSITACKLALFNQPLL